jgi:hypothetical protein
MGHRQREIKARSRWWRVHKRWGRDAFEFFCPTRMETPGLDLLVECLLKTLTPLCVIIDGAPICLEDDWRRGGGTDDFRAPPEVGRAPGGASRITEVVP